MIVSLSPLCTKSIKWLIEEWEDDFPLSGKNFYEVVLQVPWRSFKVCRMTASIHKKLGLKGAQNFYNYKELGLKG